MKKKHNKRLIFSRFTIIALAIILQAFALWFGFYKLTTLWRWEQVLTYILGVLLLVHIINKVNAAVYKLP